MFVIIHRYSLFAASVANALDGNMWKIKNLNYPEKEHFFVFFVDNNSESSFTAICSAEEENAFEWLAYIVPCLTDGSIFKRFGNFTKKGMNRPQKNLSANDHHNHVTFYSLLNHYLTSFSLLKKH